jgi:hypothetical protein
MAYQIHGLSPAPNASAWAGRHGSAQSGRLRSDRQTGAGQSARAQSNAPSSSFAAQGATLDSKVTQTGDLEVTTNEGDKISISFAALSELHAQTLQAQNGGTGVNSGTNSSINSSINYGSTSSSASLAVSVKVDGSLNDKELADIGALIRQLAAGIQYPSQGVSAAQLSDGGSLSSLNSFQFAYQKQTQVDYSAFQAAEATASSTNARAIS